MIVKTLRWFVFSSIGEQADVIVDTADVDGAKRNDFGCEDATNKCESEIYASQPGNKRRK